MGTRTRLSLSLIALAVGVLFVGPGLSTGLASSPDHRPMIPGALASLAMPGPRPSASPIPGRTMAVGNLTVGDAPQAVVYDSGKGEIYVGNVGDASFSVINDRTNTVGYGGYGVGSCYSMIYDRGRGEVFSVNIVSGLLNVINDTNNTAFTTVRNLGNDPINGAYDPAKGLLFVPNEGDIFYGISSDVVSVVNDTTNTVVANVTVGDSPDAATYDPALGEIFVANGLSNNISVINDTSLSVVATISLSNAPDGIVYDSGRGEVFVADSGLSVISPKTNSVIKTLSGVSTSYQGLGYDSRKGQILALTDYQLTTVSDSNYSFMGNVSLGKSSTLGTQALAYDPGNGYTYVTLAFNLGGAGKVALVAGDAYSLTVKETGLPTGPTWYVNRSGGPLPAYGWSASPGTPIPIWLVNGSYQYAVAANKAYAANPSQFTVVESGTSLPSQTVTFAYAYKITFQAKGLPTYFEFSVNVSGQPVMANYFFSTSIVELLPNGTFNYSAWTSSLTFDAPNSKIKVAGSSFTWDVNFTAVTYALTFNETGLVGGDVWYVNDTYTSYYGYTVPGMSATAGSNIVFDLINGTYTFAVATNHPGFKSNRSVDVVTESAGLPPMQYVSFGTAYNVTFNESGLPSGATWDAFVVGQPLQFGSTVSLTEAVPNGTYNDSFYAWNSIYYSPPGQFTISGAARTVSVPFGFLTYLQSFQPQGLPSSGTWYLNETSGPSGYPDQNGSATGGTSIGLSLVNGSYTYAVQTSDRTYATNPSISFYTSGTYPGDVAVSFHPYTYGVSFHESGLPSGTGWQVWVNSTDGGQNYHQAGVAATLVAPAVNDSYVYQIANVPGWHLNASIGGSYSGTVSVAGSQPPAVSVVFAQETYAYTLTETGLPMTAVWYLNLTAGPAGFTLVHGAASAGGSIDVALANGTYAYQVATNEKEYAASSVANLTESGGAPVGSSISFSLVTSKVTFDESGLPSGTSWFVNITSGGPSGFSLPSAVGTSGAPCVVNLPNGSFTYTVQSGDKTYQTAGGLLTIAGASSTKTVSFTRVTFAVTSQETGLPSGTEWWLNITGESPQPSIVGQIVELLPNGSYVFTVASSDKSFQAPGGSFSVTGATISLVVTFTPVAYAVAFSESGLSSDTHWSVTLGGVVETAVAPASVAFSEPNGTDVAYRIGFVPGYTSSPVSGALNVTGSSVSIAVEFTPSTSAPSVASFSVSPSSVVNGSSVTLTVTVSGGAAPFAFQYTGLPTGCSSVNSSTLTCTPTRTGTWTVEVAVSDSLGRSAFGNATLTVSAPAATGPGGPSGLANSAILDYAAIGVAVLVVAIAVALLVNRRRTPPASPSEDSPEDPPASP